MARFFMIVTLISFCALQAGGQCTKDTDCKGTRICQNGQCVEPQISPQPPAAAPAPALQPVPAAQEPPAAAPAQVPQQAPAVQQASSEPAPQFVAVAKTSDAPNLSNTSWEAGVALGPWFGGTVNIEGDVDKDASFMLKTYYDGYLMPKLAMGAYICWVPSLSYSRVSISSASFEIGGTIKPRFLISPTVALKPALEIGYRIISFSKSGIESASGMALNFNLEAEFAVHKNIAVFGALGFLAQPVGGNGDFDYSFAPIFFLNFGAEFGNY